MDEIQQIKERNKQLQQQQQQQIVIQPQQQQQRQPVVVPPNLSGQSNVPIQSSVMIQPVNNNALQQQAALVRSQIDNPAPQRPILQASYLENQNMRNSIVQSNFQGGYQMPGYNYQQQMPVQVPGQFYSNYNQSLPQQFPYQQNGNYYPPQPQGYNPQFQQPNPQYSQAPQQGPVRTSQVVFVMSQVNTSPQCQYCKSHAQQYVTLEIGGTVWCWCKDPVTRCGNCRKRLF